MSIGVIVGRFQNYELHRGHKDLIQYAASENDKIVFMLACQDSPPNKRNPLNYQQRVKILENYLSEDQNKEISHSIFSIVDKPSDEEWSKNLDNFLKITYPNEQITLYCGRDGFNNHYFGNNIIKVFHSETLIDKMNNTKLREKINLDHFDHKSFLAGVIHCINSLHPRVYSTVDIAVTKQTKYGHEVLMGTKFEGDLLRFPGGFVDPKEPFEIAARRELLEETGILTDKVNYVGNFLIDDWRTNTGYEDVFTKTVFFQTDFIEGLKPVASDDLFSVGWVSIDLDLKYIHKSHQILFRELKKFLNK